MVSASLIMPHLLKFAGALLLAHQSLIVMIVTADLANGEKNDFNATSVALKTIHFLSLLPYPDPPATASIEDGPVILPALELAMEHINQRSDVLPGFALHSVNEDSGCDITDKTYVSFVRRILSNEGTNIVGLVGPRCTASAQAIASLIHRQELSLISVHLGVSELHDSSASSYSFGIAGSTLGLAAGTLAFIEALGWTRIAVMYAPNIALYQNLYQDFTSLVHSNSTVQINTSTHITPDEFPISLIRNMRTRIIVMFLDAKLSQKTACLALHQKITYPNYQLVWVSLSLKDLNQSIEFDYEGQTYNCSVDDIESVLNRGVFLTYRFTPTDLQHQSVSGYNYNQFYDQYANRLETLNSDLHSSEPLKPSQYGPLVYDAVWALALALNHSLNNLSNYRYGMPLVTNSIAETLLATPFYGISGYIAFDANERFVKRTIDINLLHEGRIVPINISDLPDLFLADTFPEIYPEIIPFAIYVVLAIVLLELLLVVATHCVACFHRRDRSIKAVSIKLNHFVFTGVYLFVVGTLLYLLIKRFTLDEEVASIICHATWSWVLSIAFTLIVGTVTVCMWRVYRIFIHYRNPGSFISDRALAAMIFVQIIVDLVIAMTWTLLDPIQATMVSEEARELDGSITIEKERSCLSNNTLLWASALIGWKVLQLLSMLTLAIITRKIKNKDFATQNVQVASYILSVTVVLGSMLFLSLFFNRTNIHWDFGVLSLAFIVIIAVCYFSILFPPVSRLMSRKIKKDPPAPIKRVSSAITLHFKKVSTIFLFPEAALVNVN